VKDKSITFLPFLSIHSSNTRMASAAELKQILKEDSAGKNLYDHLTETLMRILQDRPQNAFDNFELLSSQVKASPLNPDPELGRPVPPSAEEVLALMCFIVGLRLLNAVSLCMVSSSLKSSIHS
jgi:hypothetical protein